MTFRNPTRSFRTSLSRVSGIKRDRRSRKRRDEKRRTLLQNLESRQLLAGPDLIGIQPNEGDLLVDGSVLLVSPNELVFRFDDDTTIDPATLGDAENAGAIRITRAGEDRVFESAAVTSDLGTSGRALFEFRARQSGSLGNGIAINVTSSARAGSSAPIITTNGREVSIDLNSTAGAVTTARDLTTAVNNDAEASALIEAIQVSGPSLEPVGTTVPAGGTSLVLDGANAAQAVTDFGTNGAVRARLISQVPGTNGRGIQVVVEQRNFGGTALPIVLVNDQVVTVQVNSFPGDPTTAQEFVTAIKSNPQSAELLSATIQEGDGDTVIGTQPTTYSPLTLSGVSDVVVEPGFIGLGDSPREVIFRFAEPLPDDLYQIDILGSSALALRNAEGEAFQDGVDLTLNFSVNLGPQIVAVVPEPVRRNADGTLSPETGRIEIHFNDDDLNPAQATDPQFYQLIYTRDTVDNTDDVVINPVSVTYSNITNIATLDFARPLSRIPDPIAPNQFLSGAARLRVGTSESLPGAPTEISLQPTAATTIDPGDTFENAFDLNSQWTTTGATTTRSAVLSSEIRNETRFELDLPGPDVAGTRDIRPEDPSRLDRTVPLDYVRGEADPIDGISVITYDFTPTWLGDDPDRNGIIADQPYQNIISEQQKQRAREVLSLYSEYLGVSFVEVAEGSTVTDVDISLAVGDLYGGDERTSSGQGGLAVVTRDRDGDGIDDLAVMDFQDFDESIDDNFGGEFFRGAMFAFGQLLGYGYADDLPQPVSQSTDFIFAPGTENELAFPSAADIVHGQFLFRPDSTDIDLYRFELDSPGSISIETIAERLADTSLLDTQLRLYRANSSGAFVEIAQNNDYFSNDSLIRIEDLAPGTYMIGVSARGNNDYDPNIPGSGFGGLTEGNYELRIDFTPGAATSLNDTSSPPQGLDGDSDGVRGGTFNYWFEPADPSNTIFVDKAANGDPNATRGSVSNPYLEIDQAIAVARPGDTIRVIGNGGVDGRLETPEDNFSYQIGLASNGLPLADGSTLVLPQGVNLQLEAGAILKMSGERIAVGSFAPTIDLSDASLQVLGTPSIVLENGLPARDATNAIIPGSVFITSINDASVGRGNQFDLPTAASPGDWGGIDFRGDLDAADETRRNLENEGIFLNHIQHADIRFGGGVVRVGGQNVSVSPIDMATTRATIINSSISDSADAAIAATPDTFREDRFTSPFFQNGGSFTPDYDRVGPEIHGNTVVDNTVNGLFVRLRTRSGATLETVNTNIRFDDTDIPHVITENLVVNGTAGGSLLQAGAPSSLIIRTTELQGAGDIPAGTYVYRIANVDDLNLESAASTPTLPITTTVTGAIRLEQLPTTPSGSRRLYRATVDPLTNEPGPFTLVGQLNASSTSFVDRVETGGAVLVESDSPLRARLDASLVIDPGTVVKVDGARIEARFGANIIAEGTSSNPVILTSLEDQRYGGGGTFDTNDRGNTVGLTPGDWGGLYIGNGSSASIDNAVVAGAGGTTRIEGGFASFNAIEVHQAELRLANSRIEMNDDGRGSLNGTRVGRMDNAPGAVFVRASQPVLIGNEFVDNNSAAISVDVNSLNYFEVNDHGRATGSLDAIDVVGNLGPLVEDNSLTNNAINGMFVRGGAVVTESVWDDVNIVHVVTDTIEVPNRHIFGGLRVISDARGSLVVKFESGDEPAGIVVGGTLISAADELRDIADRIGGALQLVGHPDFPVVLTTLADDTAGAGFTIDGEPQIDTNNDGIFFSDLDSGTLLLPTGPEVNNGILIDNDVAPDFPGFFEFQPTAGGDALIARTTVQGATQVFPLQNSLFEYSHWIDVGADGNAVRLSSTTITLQPTLVADDRVRSEGNFAGENGTVNWVMEQFFVDGRTDLVSELSFSSDSPLGEIRVINYYDPIIGTDAGDILFTEGTPGQDDFRLTILDGPEEIGFRQYGTFESGPGLVNASYEGWIADDFPDLITAPEFNLAFVPDGTVDAGVPLLNDPRFPQPNYGPGILTSALAWQVNDASTSSFVTTNLEVIAEVFGTQTLRLESGLWNGVTIREGADDRNVKAVAEQEPVRITVFDTNAIPSQAQFLGEIAPDEQSGDENQRLGFIVDGAISARDDVDVYSLLAESGTEVWLDIDRAGTHLDTVVELIDQNGVVLAASNDSIAAEGNASAIFVNTDRLDPDAARPLQLISESVSRQQLTISENIVDSTGGFIAIGFPEFQENAQVVLEDFLADPAGAVQTAIDGVNEFAELGPIRVSLLPRTGRTVDENGIITSLGDDFVLEFEFDETVFVGRQPPTLVASTVQLQGAFVTSSVQTLTLQSQDQDDFTFSPKDAGMRVRLPGEGGTENLYHIRVRSSNTNDPLDFATLTDPSLVREGLSLGRYTLQVRLREADEFAGTQVSLADVRFATTGLQIIGQPFHSPLLGEEQESAAPNDTLAEAQRLGFFGVDGDAGLGPAATPAVESGPLSSDRLAKSIGGEISGATDVDWYQFDITYDDITRDEDPLLLSTVFDLDYASNFARSDMALYVFNALGELIYTGTNSNIADDQPGSPTGNDTSDLSRGSAGTEDPFIGAVELLEGTYFLAVSNQTQVPISMDQFFNAATANPLVRLSPVDSVTRIADDNFDFGFERVLFDENSIVPYSLDDVVLYVNTVNGLEVVNPFTGQSFGAVGNFGDEVRDIAFRANGELYAYAGFGNRGPGDNNWFYHQVDTGNATLSAPLTVGGGGLQTFHNQNAENNAIQILEQDSNDGIEVEGITIRSFGGSEVGYLIGNRPVNRTGLGGLDYFQNLLYEFDETTGEVIGPTTNRALAVAGAGTSVREVGFLDTEAPANAVSTQLGFSDATIIDAAGNQVAGLVDGDTFTIVSGTDIDTFELDQGTTILSNGPVVDGDTFTIDGTVFEFNSGARLQIDAPAPTGNLIGGETVTITGSNGEFTTFEFVRLGQPGVGNIGISTLDATSQPLPLATVLNNFVSQVNLNVLDARASIVNNEVVFGNIDNIVVGGTVGGLALVGDPALNDPTAIEVPISETSGSVAVIAAMDAAIRSVSIPVSSAGNQLALPESSAIDVSGTPTLSIFGAPGVAPGNIAIQLLPTDTADVIARRIVDAIDSSSLANVTAQIEGSSVAISGGSLSVPTGSNFRAGGIPTGGQVTGVEILNGNLYAVTDTGGLFFVSNAELNSNGNRTIGRYIQSATDLVGFEFEGVRAGPNSVDGGAYQNILFGITAQGDIVAFDTLGQLQPVFAGGRSVISTGIGGALGLDFSTLDFNLWHFTDSELNRNADPGHSGIANNLGGVSLAFNYDVAPFFDNFNGSAEQPVQVTLPSTVITNPRVDGGEVLGTYNFPGGARGALNSNSFNLEGFSAADEPVLYFSYFLETDDEAPIDPLFLETTDALRVYVVTADGTEHLLATNAGKRTDPSFLGDEFDDPAQVAPYDDTIDIQVQQLFDNTGSWRQARVPLGDFAGQDGLSLRVEFASGGAIVAGTDSVRALAASDLLAGGSLVVNGEVFSIDFAPSVFIPSGPALAELYNDPTERATITLDGQTYVIDDGARTVNVGEIAISFTAPLETLSAVDIATVVADAIRIQPPPATELTGFNFSDPEDSPSVPSGRNDLLFEATQLPFEGQSTTITGSGLIGSNPALGAVTNLNDIDLQRIDVIEGATISVEASFAADPTQSLAVRYFNAQGAPLASTTNPTTGTIDFIANFDGPLFIGLSAENNQNYDPRVAGSAVDGQTGAYNATIAVDVPLTVLNDGSLIEFVGSNNLVAEPASLFPISGTSAVEGLPIQLSRSMDANEVALEIQRALANRFSNGNRERFPVRGPNVVLGTLSLDDVGPFADPTASYGASFASSPIAAARDNDHEGVYLDDFIIGFAERGEQVINSPVVNQAFVADQRFAFAQPDDPLSNLDTGSYQVEIRDASEYIASDDFPPADFNVLRNTNLNRFRQFDTNTRLTDSTSVVVRGADSLLDGQSFSLFDGRATVEFEFDLVEADNGVTPGRVPIPFTLQAVEPGTETIDGVTNLPVPGTGVIRPQSAAEVAASIVAAINQSNVQSVIQVTAIPSAGNGVASDTIDFVGDVVIGDESQAFEEIIRTQLRGDENRERESQGVILVENSRFLFNSEFGVDISHDVTATVNGVETSSLIRYPRNLVELNTESLRPGVVVQSNVFAFNEQGGIQIDGIDPGLDQTSSDPVAYERIVNNTFVGGSISPGTTSPSGTFGSVLFPQGAISFADQVVEYLPDASGSPPTTTFQTPNSALGIPDGDGRGPEPVDGTTTVSLGTGGSITLQFTNNLLTGSGDSLPDLAVFETGSIESVLVEISRDGSSFFTVGQIGGLTTSLDIDDDGFGPQDRFSFVRLTDLRQGNPLDASLGADIDAVGAISSVPIERFIPGGIGINIGPGAAPTLLNNVISNSVVGVQADPTLSSPVLGGNSFYRNTDDASAGVSLGLFTQQIAATEAVFVDAPNLVFAPAAGSSIIDSSIDSLEERASLTTVRDAIGIPPSPILAPSLDVNGQVRVDDPNVEPPGGLGESVFKDRGASDRGDLVGPRVTLLSPLAPGIGLDAGRATVLGAAPQAFEIQLVDGIAPADIVPGTGIDDGSVTSGSLILLQDGVALVEGVDYRFGYNNSTNVIRLTPIAGVWETNSTYVIRMIDSSDAIIQANDGINYIDGETLSIIDGLGQTTNFEYETGVTVNISSSLGAAAADGVTVTVFDGSVSRQFEFDNNDAVSPLSIPVTIPAAGNATQFAEALAAAINADAFLSLTATAENNFVQLTGGTPLTSVTSSSVFVTSSGQIGTAIGFGLLIPNEDAGVATTVTDGQTFIIRRGAVQSATFEIDSDGLLNDTNAIPVNVSLTSSLDEIADELVRAIGGAGLGLNPSNVSFGRVFLGGDTAFSVDVSDTVLEQLGVPGETATTPINISIDQTAEQNVLVVQQAIEAQNLPGITSSTVDVRVFLEGTQGVSGFGAVDSVVVQDEVGNQLQSNQADGRTELVIFIGTGFDYGDAPAPYASTMADGGARHAIDPLLSLGQSITADPDAELPNADNDDGVTLPSVLQAGFSSDFEVFINNLDVGDVTDQALYLDAWFDWDQDGVFEASERLRWGTAGTGLLPLAAAGADTLSVDVPDDALSGETFVRFRLSESMNVGPLGDVTGGEVEDYRIVVSNNPFQNPTDRFDVNASGAVTPLDALELINALSRLGTTGVDLSTNPITQPPFPDVNGDGLMTTGDAIQVINRLAALFGNGEGEQTNQSYVAAGPGVLASGTTALGDLLLSDSSGPAWVISQDRDDNEPEVVTDSSASETSQSTETSVFDSAAMIDLDLIVDDLASDTASAGGDADGEDESGSAVDLFFAGL
ncbi:MAG: GEVED domain-containing protein [Planctomycetota bacterium]